MFHAEKNIENYAYLLKLLKNTTDFEEFMKAANKVHVSINLAKFAHEMSKTLLANFGKLCLNRYLKLQDQVYGWKTRKVSC